jgi:hypothetical protein
MGLLAAVIILWSIFGYRRVLREEAGLIVPKKVVPLEESPLSYKRLRQSFLRYGIAILVLFFWMVFVQARYRARYKKTHNIGTHPDHARRLQVGKNTVMPAKAGIQREYENVVSLAPAGACPRPDRGRG